jgi:hypothetical protein
VIARVQPVGDFVEQQQPRPAGKRACNQHQAALAIGKSEETALGELRYTQAA